LAYLETNSQKTQREIADSFGSRWKKNTKTNLKVTGCYCTEWTHLDKDRDKWPNHVNIATEQRVP
jgi:hypothetical protein